MPWNKDGEWENDPDGEVTPQGGPVGNQNAVGTVSNPDMSMINRDSGSWEATLRDAAKTAGVSYDPSDLAGIQRNVSYARNAGMDPATFIDQQRNIYAQRASNVPQGSEEQGGPRQGNPGVWGSVPAPFGEQYSTPDRPSWLQGEYKTPTWQGGDFHQPTATDLLSDPGYLTRMDATQRGFERSAAAKGSVLDGGFIGRTLPKALGEQASNEYGAADNRAYRNYQTTYGQFRDTVGDSVTARGINEGAYQSDVGNALSQYNTRYKGYLDAITNARNANNDYWQQNNDVVRNGLTASGLVRPTG